MCSQARGPHTKRSTLTIKVQNYIGRATMFPYPGYLTRMFALNFVVPALVNTWNPQIQPPAPSFALTLTSFFDELEPPLAVNSQDQETQNDGNGRLHPAIGSGKHKYERAISWGGGCFYNAELCFYVITKSHWILCRNPHTCREMM